VATAVDDGRVEIMFFKPIKTLPLQALFLIWLAFTFLFILIGCVLSARARRKAATRREVLLCEPRVRSGAGNNARMSIYGLMGFRPIR
jgi:uncharacterized protein (DUF58 family)